MSKTVTISKTKIAKIHKLAKSMPRLTKVAALMKKAQEEGNLGPDEVKDIAEDTQEILLSVVEMVGDIIEGVPSEEEPIEEVTEEVTEEPTEPEIPTVESREDDNEDRKEEKIQIAKLEKEITNMKNDGIHKDLTIKYAKLFPESVREAKEKEFATSKDSIPVLQARLKEASKIMTGRKSIKVAQLTDGSITYIEDDDSDNSSSLDFKGKF